MMKRRPLILSTLLQLILLSTLRLWGQSECRECRMNFPGGRHDSIMDVQLSDQRIIRNVLSARRLLFEQDGLSVQGIRLQMMRNGLCFDTTLIVDDVESFSIGGLGIGGQTLVVPVEPAREFVRKGKEPTPSTNFIDISAVAGYAGPDQSERSIGFRSVHYGGEILLAPFGTILGEQVSFALGGGLMVESDRVRFPLLGHLRWTLTGSGRVVTEETILPSPCQFGTAGSAIATPEEESDLENVSRSRTVDSSVYFLRERRLVEGSFRPFVYGEAGLLVDGSFEGEGSEPAVNSEDYGEYLAGAGIGLPIGLFSFSLGYRYSRLNLRTPCPACEDKYVVNTDNVHAILLKLGLLLGL